MRESKARTIMEGGGAVIKHEVEDRASGDGRDPRPVAPQVVKVDVRKRGVHLRVDLSG